MKKLTTLVLLAFFMLTGMSAQTTAKEQAQTLAERFFKQGQRVQSGAKGVRSAKATSLECRWDSRDVLSASSAAPTFYAFEPEVGQGFVIVAGDGDNARVIGYSYENSLPEVANMPDGMADFLGDVDAQVMAVRGGAPSVSVKSATPVGNVVVNLNTAPWGQRAPFNNLCLTSTGASAATGCVPTAYSILMHYYKWPVAATETKVIHSSTGESITLGHNYDWDNMISNYSGTYSDAQATAVATLMRDLGYAYEVVYGTSSTQTGGIGEGAARVINIFKYKSETPASHGASYATVRATLNNDALWKQYIKESLDAGCPIPYSSSVKNPSTGESRGRHIFILDGYTDADYYHFNWGWSGSGNGWYTLDNMTTDDTSDYSTEHRAYFMLKPNRPTHVVSVEPSSYLMGTATINGSSVAVVEEGQKATLVATPNSADYVFVKWTKGEELVSRSATTTVTITGADTYTAHFGEAAATADVEIAVAASTGGTATINGTDAVTIAVGEKITLVATPQSGYYFVNWTKDGEVVSTEATFSTTAQSYCTYTANFEAVETVTIKSYVNTGGYAYVGDGTVNSLKVEKGSQNKVRAVVNPESGKVFYFWTLAKSYTNGGEIVSNKEVYEFVATTGVTYYANFFAEGTYAPVAISATASSGGEVTVNSASGSANVALGGDVVLSATPDYGYRFLNWTDGNGNVVSTEPNYTTVARAAANYTANFERLAVDPVTPPVVTLPEVTGDFIKGDGVLRFYRLALPITLSSFQNDFGSNATQVYAFWQEAETFLNKVYIPLGICFEVVEDARLIASSRNDIDNNPINAAAYGTELTNGLIGEGSYDVGLWISLPADGDNSGVSALSGAYSKVAKGSGYAKADVTVVGHELGHLFGSQHVHDGGVATEPGFGSSIMGYGDQLPFFSVASLRAIRSEMVSKNHSFYADAARTQLVGSDGGNNYVYGVVPGTSSAPMITETGMKTSYRIPKGACFAMPIPATDANGDRLTYAFQQYEDGAVFHAYAPQESNVVDFRPSYILWADDDNYFTAKDGTDIPSMPAGTYNFAAVVNDLPAASNMTLAAMQSNPFYSNYDAFQTQVTIVDGTSFTVSLSDNKASYAAGEKVTVTWDVNDSYFGTQRVNIRMSDDYGKTFKYTLAENVDVWARSCQVTMPNLNMTTVREQFGNYKTNVRPGIIRVEVVGDIAYSLSLTDPASLGANGGFLVTGGSGEGGGDEGEGEQTEDITTEKADLSNLLAEMKAYIGTFATVTPNVVGGVVDYKVTFTADHGAVTEDMIAEAYRAMDDAEVLLETATTKAELNTSIAALQAELTDLQTNKALPGEGDGGDDGDDDGDDAAELADAKIALGILLSQTNTLIENCGEVGYVPGTDDIPHPLQTQNPSGAFYLSTNADHNEFCTSGKEDGGGIGELVDGDTNNFFHSQWESADPANKVTEPHFLQVDLGDGNEMDKFKFSYVTRNGNSGNPYPTKMIVSASTDGSDFSTTLATLNSDLPNKSGATYESTEIECGTQYKYLRFTVVESGDPNVTNVQPLVTGVYCFTMSEFGLIRPATPGSYVATANPGTAVTDEMLTTTYNYMKSAESSIFNNEDATLKEVQDATAALQALYDQLLEASKTIVGGGEGEGGEGEGEDDDLATAQAALQDMIAQTQTLLSANADVTKSEKEVEEKLNLQTTDDQADAHLYCNAPHSDEKSTDYSPASEGYWLLDGDDTTFLHTNWDNSINSADGLDHYIHIYSAEALDKFTFTYTTRWNENGEPWVGNPTVIEVEGCNTPNGTYESIATLSDKGTNPLPTQYYKPYAQVYTSDLLTASAPYKYIRFRVTATEQNNTAYGHKWFYISEFAFTKYSNQLVYEASLKGLPNGVTEDIAIDTYKAIETAQSSLGATTPDELNDATEALQAQYNILLAASETTVNKTNLRKLIDDTQALIDGCYDVKDDKKIFKYEGSLYIDEDKLEAAGAAVEKAETAYGSATLTQDQCDAEVATMQSVYNDLAYAVSHATLPVLVTTDLAKPYIYTIGINRSATSLLEWDANTSMVAVAGKYEFGNEAQAWCFFDATDGRVYIAPYQDFSSSSYRVLSSKDLSEGNSKVMDVVKGTDGFTQEWTIVYNADKNMYNIYCLNDNGDKFYFSNHGGDGKKMGFYNNVNDPGSLFRFDILDEKSFSYSEAYNKLYNYVNNSVKVRGTIVGDDKRVGFYTVAMANAYNEAYQNANTAVKDVPSDATCEDYYNALVAANGGLHINMPMDGKVYSFRSAADADYCKNALVYADVADNKMRWSADKPNTDAATLWSFAAEGTSGYTVQNLHTGTSMQSLSGGQASSLTDGKGGTVTIVSLSGDGQVGIKVNGTMMHAQSNYNAVVNWSTEANGASAWFVDEVDLSEVEFLVSISKYGYAGLYLNYPVEMPEGLEAYVVNKATGSNGVATLEKIEDGIVPANTGVILKSDEAYAAQAAKEYVLEHAATQGTEPAVSLLSGANYHQYVKAEPETDYYLFGAKSGVVGLYKTYEEYADAAGKDYVDLTAEQVTAATTTLPQAGYIYYFCNKHMDGDVYFSMSDNNIAFNKEQKTDASYKWECIVEGDKYIFKNMSTGKYFGWQQASNDPYSWSVSDTQKSNKNQELQDGCVTLKGEKQYLVIKDASGWNQADDDDFYNETYSSSFYFIPTAKRTGKTNDGGYFKCSANKIYLPYSAAANAAKFGFSFGGGMTTDIEEALFGNEEGQQIFDLQGRRVERITAPGLYIVNGKKRYVKAAKF